MYLIILLFVIMYFNSEHGKMSPYNNLFDKRIPHINVMSNNNTTTKTHLIEYNQCNYNKHLNIEQVQRTWLVIM